jgi:hypothetical protein
VSPTPDLRRSTPLDYSLMRDSALPIGGLGAEVWGSLQGWCWCGYCGYTGRMLGPRQAACPERHGWHRWLEHCAERELPIP